MRTCGMVTCLVVLLLTAVALVVSGGAEVPLACGCELDVPDFTVHVGPAESAEADFCAASYLDAGGGLACMDCSGNACIGDHQEVTSASRPPSYARVATASTSTMAGILKAGGSGTVGRCAAGV